MLRGQESPALYVLKASMQSGRAACRELLLPASPGLTSPQLLLPPKPGLPAAPLVDKCQILQDTEPGECYRTVCSQQP